MPCWLSTEYFEDKCCIQCRLQKSVQTEDFGLKCPVDFILNIIETSVAYSVRSYPMC